HIAAFLLKLADSPKYAKRGPAGLVLCHARRQILRNELIEMKTKFFIELVICFPAARQRAQAQTDFVERPHLRQTSWTTRLMAAERRAQPASSFWSCCRPARVSA